MNKLLLFLSGAMATTTVFANIKLENVGAESVIAEITVTDPTAGGKVVWKQTINPGVSVEAFRPWAHKELAGKDLMLDIKSVDGTLIAGTEFPKDKTTELPTNKAYFYIAAKRIGSSGDPKGELIGGIYEWYSGDYTNESSFNEAKDATRFGKIPGEKSWNKGQGKGLQNPYSSLQKKGIIKALPLTSVEE